MRDHELERIAVYIDEPLPSSNNRLGAIHDVGRAAVTMAPILGIVMEGVWREADMTAGRIHSLRAPVAIVPNPAFPASVHYVVEHESNGTKTDASLEYFICIPIAELERKLRDRDRVHLRQTRDGGLARDLIRRVSLKRGPIQFLPLGEDPSIKPLTGQDAEVRGLVIGHVTSYRV